MMHKISVTMEFTEDELRALWRKYHTNKQYSNTPNEHDLANAERVIKTAIADAFTPVVR